jgi:uncharacterized protein (DUF1919 family)
MDKLLYHTDELLSQFVKTTNKEQKKIEKEAKKDELPINPKFVFEKKPKNVPKKQYRKPKPETDNKEKNPFNTRKRKFQGY